MALRDATGDARWLFSVPVPVHFWGWESTTSRLQAAGWQLAANQDFNSLRLTVAMHHPDLKLYILTEAMDYDYFAARERHGLRQPSALRVRWVSPRMETVVTNTDFSKFQAIDAEPQFATVERKSIEDFNLFAAQLVRTKEIIVEPQDVQQCLDLIQRLQSPKMSEIRERARRDLRRGESANSEPGPKMNFHAQVMSLAA